MSIPRFTTVAVAWAALAAVPAQAQRDTAAAPSIEVSPGEPVPVSGRVLDARTGSPLHGANVKLGARVNVFTDDQGRFAAQAPTGMYGFVVTLLGYRTRGGIWEVAAGDTGRVIRLEPDPVVLEGLRVQVRRIERRVRAAGSSARAYDRDALVNTGYSTLLQYIFAQGQLSFAPCGSLSTAPASAGGECVRVRGVGIRPCVVIDEAPSSLDQLAIYHPQELYRLEVYRGGAVIVAYTADFARRIARDPVSLPPLDGLVARFCGTR
jgi:hypothetical protein